eukprot:990577_1
MSNTDTKITQPTNPQFNKVEGIQSDETNKPFTKYPLSEGKLNCTEETWENDLMRSFQIQYSQNETIQHEQQQTINNLQFIVSNLLHVISKQNISLKNLEKKCCSYQQKLYNLQHKTHSNADDMDTAECDDEK